MDLALANKLVLVTGAMQGIGFATAEALLREGARVVITGRSEPRLASALKRLSPLGEVHGFNADHATAEGAHQTISFVDALGEIDVLINNVGFFEVKPFTQATDEDWQGMFDVNVLSGVRLARWALPKMLQRNSGRIIFIASEQSAKPHPDMVHYAMSKAAQVSIARGLAEATQGTNVTVNSVLVAPTWTEGVEVFLGDLGPRMDKTVDEMRQAYFEADGRTSLLQRFAEPAEIAAVVTFLASGLSAAINGAAQRAEGGIVRSMF
jgi:NAD(P)-dependent dehydrogenase (short-subunit alcohol dehydrogenase family)